MGFSYDPTDLDTELNRIRMEIGDTDSSEPYLLDEEVTIIQSECSSFHSRVSKCCTVIANKLSRMGKVEFDGYHENFNQIVENFRKMAFRYGNMSVGSYPYSSSIYVDDKEVYSDDSDIVQPAFKRGMNDNT